MSYIAQTQSLAQKEQRMKKLKNRCLQPVLLGTLVCFSLSAASYAQSNSHLGFESKIFSLVRNKETEQEGFEILKRRMANGPDGNVILMLRKYPDWDGWKRLPDPVPLLRGALVPVSYTHLRAHETKTRISV